MKKSYLLFIFLLTIFTSYAQDISLPGASYRSDILRDYKMASPEVKQSMDSLYGQIETYIETNQIKSICGIDFGISREKALSILHKKYGVPSSDSNDMTLSFDNIKYAGLDFNNVHFLFQSDGIRSYFNCCIFVKNAKDKSEVIKTTELYYSVLSRKYNLLEIIDHNGFNTYSGGVSPLWDGKWYTFLENLDTGKYLSALHIDVIEYDNRLANVFGYKYGVRIIYGPYEFVEEEF